MAHVDSGPDRVSPLQVKDLVYRKLRTALIDQSFAPGESLREVTLSEMYGVSKTPIREALVRLQQDGLVDISAYRGARASVYTADTLAEIYEAREILESECVRRAAERDGPAVAQALSTTVATARRALRADDLTAAADALDEFDDILFGQLQNSFLEDVRERLSAHLRRAGRSNLTPDAVTRSLEEHDAIIAAIAASDPDAAVSTLRTHLGSVRSQQITDLEGRVATAG